MLSVYHAGLPIFCGLVSVFRSPEVINEAVSDICQRTQREIFFISFSLTLRGQKEKKTSFVSLLSTRKKGEKEKEAQMH